MNAPSTINLFVWLGLFLFACSLAAQVHGRSHVISRRDVGAENGEGRLQRRSVKKELDNWALEEEEAAGEARDGLEAADESRAGDFADEGDEIKLEIASASTKKPASSRKSPSPDVTVEVGGSGSGSTSEPVSEGSKSGLENEVEPDSRSDLGDLEERSDLANEMASDEADGGSRANPEVAGAAKEGATTRPVAIVGELTEGKEKTNAEGAPQAANRFFFWPKLKVKGKVDFSAGKNKKTTQKPKSNIGVINTNGQIHLVSNSSTSDEEQSSNSTHVTIAVDPEEKKQPLLSKKNESPITTTKKPQASNSTTKATTSPKPETTKATTSTKPETTKVPTTEATGKPSTTAVPKVMVTSTTTKDPNQSKLAASNITELANSKLTTTTKPVESTAKPATTTGSPSVKPTQNPTGRPKPKSSMKPGVTKTTKKPKPKTSKKPGAPTVTTTKKPKPGTSKKPTGKPTQKTTLKPTKTSKPTANPTKTPTTRSPESGSIKEMQEGDKLLAVVITNKGGFKGRRVNAKAIETLMKGRLSEGDVIQLHTGKKIEVSTNNSFVFPAGHYYFGYPIRFAGFSSP